MENLNAFGANAEILKDIVTTPMPFGKHKGTILCYLPVNYLEWFQTQGFPPGKLGMMLHTLYEIRLNGLDDLLLQIKKIHKIR